MRSLKFSAVLSAVLWFSFSAVNAAECKLPISGIFRIHNTPYNGQVSIKTVVFDKMTSKTLWSNDGASVNISEPLTGFSSECKGGYFKISLGDERSGEKLYSDIFSDNKNTAIRIWIKPYYESSYSQLSPDQEIYPVFKSDYSEETGTISGKSASDFSAVTHDHSIGEVSGSINDAQIPDNITVENSQKGGGFPASAAAAPNTVLVMPADKKFSKTLFEDYAWTFTVNKKNGDYTDIASAAAAAASKASINQRCAIILTGGIHEITNLNLPDYVDIIGTGIRGNILSGPSNAATLTLNKHNTIKNITIEGSSFDAPLQITGGNAIIESLIIINNSGSGVSVSGAADVVIKNCDIRANQKGLYISGSKTEVNSSYICGKYDDAVLAEGTYNVVKIYSSNIEGQNSAALRINAEMRCETFNCRLYSANNNPALILSTPGNIFKSTKIITHGVAQYAIEFSSAALNNAGEFRDCHISSSQYRCLYFTKSRAVFVSCKIESGADTSLPWHNAFIATTDSMPSFFNCVILSRGFSFKGLNAGSQIALTQSGLTLQPDSATVANTINPAYNVFDYRF